MQDISEEIIRAKDLLKNIEMMMSNPLLTGRDKIYNEIIKLDNCVLTMLSKMEQK